MDKLIRFNLLIGCLFFFTICIIAGLEVSYPLHQIVIALFILFGLVVVIRYLIILIAAINEKITTKYNENLIWAPSVSIIVPAFNEENLIEAALISLTRLDYPDYEIIVIDDGSTDKTAHIAHQVATQFPLTRIRIISQANSGKAWSLNTGIEHAQGDLVVCVDSDSRLNPDALEVGVQHFKNSRVAAVGGYISVINTKKLITKLQQLEYMIGQNFIRRGLSFFNMVTIVPGPIGMFRKSAILEVGGYNTLSDCFAEDADLTVRLLAQGWHAKGDTRMIAYTEAPETIYTLLRQRYRWKRGIFQALFDNFYSLITSPNLKCVAIGCILIFESFLLDVIGFGITLFALASFLAFAKFTAFIWAFVIIVVLDLIVLVFANIGQGHLLRNFWLLILQKLSYAYVLQAWGIFALLDELSSTKMNWDKLERTGSAAYRIET